MKHLVLWLPALLVCLGLPFPAPGEAHARGGAVTQNLLEKGLAHLQRAQQHYFGGNDPRSREEGRRAERLFEDAWGQDASDVRTPMLGGQASAFAKDLAAATKWVNRLMRMSRLREGEPDVHYLSAFVQLIGAKRPDRALVSLKRMHSLNPRVRAAERDNLWFMAHRDYGKAYMDAEKWDEAIAQFKSAAILARSRGKRRRELSMLGNIGMVLRRADRFIEAQETFESLVKAEPGDPLWHWHLGLTLAIQTRMAEAIPSYREVIRLREAGRAAPGVFGELGQAYLRLANCLRQVAARERDEAKRKPFFDQAHRLLKRYQEEAPQHSLAYKWMGVLLFEDLERPYEALPQFHRAFELDPDCEDSLAYIIKIHERYPPPPEQLAAGDPEAVREAWKAPIVGWKKNIQAGAKRRKMVRDERVKKTGDSGCD